MTRPFGTENFDLMALTFICKRRLIGAMCRNHRIKRLVPCQCLDRHVKESYKMSMVLAPRPYVQLLLLQSAFTSMCRHMYDWNIVNCDVKQPIHLNSPYPSFEKKYLAVTFKPCEMGLSYMYFLLQNLSNGTKYLTSWSWLWLLSYFCKNFTMAVTFE